MQSGNIKSVFFDLDRTLWDFEKNANETLVELFRDFNFDKLTIATPLDFVNSFHKHSKALWILYDQRIIDKQTLRERRFQLAMDEMEIATEFRPNSMWDHFLDKCPTRTNLLPGAKDVLESLSKRFSLYIITNGFKEVQRRKLECSGIESYFKDVIISEEVGYKKPEKEIFELALTRSGFDKSQAVMVGDSFELDIIGAINAGLGAIWFNPFHIENPTKTKVLEVKSLTELRKILI
ncbi:MAG: YjjG family noncanonical pyrimidine nucleotidase [Bacteroidetes bacterium]|nr:YjjG family noncanonical pyrimidine nucleotidase [Bacteroidota bacterium]